MKHHDNIKQIKLENNRITNKRIKRNEINSKKINTNGNEIRIYEIMGYDYPNYENIYNNKNIMNYLYFINEKPIKEFSEHKKDITDLSWSKFKFNYLLSSSIDNYVILWDIIKKPNCKGKFKHDDYVTCIQFSPTDENIFITGCFNKSIRIYNINDIIKKSKDKLKETISKTPTKNYGDILIQDKIEEMRIKKEEEDAKYETNKKNKKNIRNLYGSTKSRLASIKAQNQAPKDKIQSFGEFLKNISQFNYNPSKNEYLACQLVFAFFALDLYLKYK